MNRISVRVFSSGDSRDSADTMNFASDFGIRSTNEVFPFDKADEVTPLFERMRIAKSTGVCQAILWFEVPRGYPHRGLNFIRMENSTHNKSCTWASLVLLRKISPCRLNTVMSSVVIFSVGGMSAWFRNVLQSQQYVFDSSFIPQWRHHESLFLLCFVSLQIA